ncbi:MAG: hypothetical protein KJ592_00935, partial [Nanoarchaeota archaeon]|nr:hypothetical protein [Nanoarchaeota archaeon]
YEKFWKYDEGLATFMDYYSCNRLGWLENMKNKTKYPSARLYYTYAIKFRDLLRDKKNPKERNRVFIDLKKKLINH